MHITVNVQKSGIDGTGFGSTSLVGIYPDGSVAVYGPIHKTVGATAKGTNDDNDNATYRTRASLFTDPKNGFVTWTLVVLTSDKPGIPRSTQDFLQLIKDSPEITNLLLSFISDAKPTDKSTPAPSKTLLLPGNNAMLSAARSRHVNAQTTHLIGQPLFLTTFAIQNVATGQFITYDTESNTLTSHSSRDAAPSAFRLKIIKTINDRRHEVSFQEKTTQRWVSSYFEKNKLSLVPVAGEREIFEIGELLSTPG